MTDVPDPDQTCMNCGQPATQYTTTRGAATRFFCDACAAKAYPVNTGQLRLFAEDQAEPMEDRFGGEQPASEEEAVEAVKPKRTTKKST